MVEKTKVYLAVTAPDARLAEGLGLPCVCLYYRVGETGGLQRAQLPLTGRGGLLGIYDIGGLSAAQPEKLARDIQAECGRRGFGGVVLDVSPAPDRLNALSALCAALKKQQLRLFLPETLSELSPGSVVVAPAAVSGGSFSQMLDALVSRYGAENLCLDLVRGCSDFPMPSYDPDGRPLSAAEFAQLREIYQPQSFFSPQLCAKYFTYRRQDGSTHFVLFDDPDTAQEKLNAISAAGVGYVFLLYSEWGREARGLLGK